MSSVTGHIWACAPFLFLYSLRLLEDMVIKRRFSMKFVLVSETPFMMLITTFYPKIVDKYKDIKSKKLLWEMIKIEIRSNTIRN